ncbi:unnamed protein product, partial [Rotaria magnacalcarata]
MCCTLTLAVLLYVAYYLYKHFFPPPDINPKDKYVLISGCDTGFGHALAIELDKQVEKKTTTLHALVNNAGIAISGYIDWNTSEFLRKTMDVNFFGHVAMTKKFLPLLISKRDSRVINICSVAGFLAPSYLSAYSASKYALESFSDCLRREMAPWGLRVSAIEPGFMRTPIIESTSISFEDLWSSLPKDVQMRWGEDFVKENLSKRATSPLIKYAEDPMKVVRALQHAIINTKPN